MVTTTEMFNKAMFSKCHPGLDIRPGAALAGDPVFGVENGVGP